ncbi:MAG: DEAD/DEAH box helicase [Treponema sp.]|nr:DEAD/DEAH box helicase [Treponema sp.]
MDEINVFSELSHVLQDRLSALSITTPTPVQSKIIPELIKGKSILFQSETGTGKTFAYLLPFIQKLEAEENKEQAVRLLICTPTLELASQIRDAAKTVTFLKTALFLGGAPIKRQTDLLKEKPDIVIGNPARLLELIRLKKLRLNGLEGVVFDEVDRLVKRESKTDTEALLKMFPEHIQTAGCSATITNAVRQFFSGIDSVVMPPEDVLRKRITHWALYAEQRDKIDLLRSLLAVLNPEKVLIFTSRSDQVENIVSKLMYKKIDCAGLHAKEDKSKRKASIDRFRSGKCPILVTSDLAARGLDIQGITHVIQMDLPDDDDFFIHRAGRTARAGKTGINIVIGDEYEMHRYSTLEKKLKIIVYPKILYKGKVTAPENMQ